MIGGGIPAWPRLIRARELDPACEVALLEASNRLGGILQTERRDGYLIERGADVFTTREPWHRPLPTHRFHRPVDSHQRRLSQGVRPARRGGLIPVPEGFTLMSPARVWPVVKTPLLSASGRQAASGDGVFCPSQTRRRRREPGIVRRPAVRPQSITLIQPLIGGIYTADPKKLSMAATMARFMTWKSGTAA